MSLFAAVCLGQLHKMSKYLFWISPNLSLLCAPPHTYYIATLTTLTLATALVTMSGLGPTDHNTQTVFIWVLSAEQWLWCGVVLDQARQHSGQLCTVFPPLKRIKMDKTWCLQNCNIANKNLNFTFLVTVSHTIVSVLMTSRYQEGTQLTLSSLKLSFVEKK